MNQITSLPIKSYNPLEEIREYPGWQGCVSKEEIRNCLSGKDSYTYALFETNNQWYLSYVNLNGRIKHMSIQREDNWVHRNGGLSYGKTLEELIKNIMVCGDRHPIPYK